MKKTLELREGWDLAQYQPVDRLSASELDALAQGGAQTWYSLTLPAQVHEVLLQHGVIEDPVELGKCEECLWVSDLDWIYRRSFSFDEKCTRVFLNFKGLDTLVDIYLNGELIGVHKDMYFPLRVEITKYLKKENVLVLHFHSTQDYLRKHPEAVTEYGKVKLEAAALYPDDIDGYIRHKSPVIEKIYREIGLL